MRSIVLAMLFGLMASSGFAQLWVDQATISPTAPLLAGHVCYTDGRDIACDASAPLLSGLGSGLGDRIVSGTLSMVATSATGYISLTTVSTTWGYLSSGANYLPNLKTATISVSTAIQVGSNSLICSSGISGTMRYSQVSSTMEYCNGSAWASMGPSSTSPVAFLVNNNGINETVSAGATTKLTWSTKNFDTNNNFASDRFTATISGKYIFSVTAGCSNSGGTSVTYCEAGIKKNGVFVAQNGPQSSATNYLGGNAVIVLDMAANDYVEAYITTNTNTVLGSIDYTNFSGAMLSPQGGGGSGSATPAGTTTDVQFNSAGALGADTGKFTYASGQLNVANVSASNVSASTVTVSQNGTGCTTATVGSLRRNPTTNKMQVCQGW